MVKVKEPAMLLPDGSIDTEQWLQQLSAKSYFQDLALIRHALSLSQLAGGEQATETGASCFQQGLAMADILADLDVDQETLAAAVLFDTVHFSELSLADVAELLGESIARLVKGVKKMSDVSHFLELHQYPQSKHQIDNVRKMILAMADDVRVVLIKLAERLCVLRSAGPLRPALRCKIATEAMEIYAPLANRLGIGAIKWEMEDLAFRYLHPDEYKAIAKALKAKRLDRDRYVYLIVDLLKKQLENLGLGDAQVNGRAKHIHSIYRKMKRKNVMLDEIYDATAVRILVDTHEQCYQTLNLVHQLWHQIPLEFDDYIAKPKRNGYQSLHTSVIGPEQRIFEVQIRTHEMHLQAEMGIAAHWKYKEGGLQFQNSQDRKIEWLREVLAWHHDLTLKKDEAQAIETEFLDDRVYVFTPKGDVLDLPHLATVLDFAYHVHSELGHRCRGAKVNGAIVPLTYILKNCDCVTILTSKEARPSRDWINPHLNYLKTSRAKAKVLNWFKMQHFDKNRSDGQEILEKELKALGLQLDSLDGVMGHFKIKRMDDFFAAIGRGEIKLGQIINRLVPSEVLAHQKIGFKPSIKKVPMLNEDLRVEGVGRLLTHMARCCQPLPGDEVIGYITLGRGVSIHRKDCPNVIDAGEKQRQRFLTVYWEKAKHSQYLVDILIKAFDRANLLRDITALFSMEKAHVFSLNSRINREDNIAELELSIELDGLNALSRILAKLKQMPNVFEASRIFNRP